MNPNVTADPFGENSRGGSSELTMAALLDSYPMPTKASRFDVVKGYVVSKSRAGLLVDIGAKTESVCPIDHAGDLKPGDTAEFLVIPGLEDGAEDGAVRLSYTQQQSFTKCTDMQLTSEVTQARVMAVSDDGAGLRIDCNGLFGFAPRSLVDVHGSLQSLVGQNLPVKVLRVGRQIDDRGKLRVDLVVSHKDATREVKLAFLDSLKVGDTVNGTVAKILNEKARGGDETGAKEMGALIDLGNLVTGFVHRTEASYSRSVKVSDVLPVGSQVAATVLEINRDTLQVKLSAKKFTMNREALGQLTSGGKISGTVSHVLHERPEHGRPQAGGARREIGLLVDLGNRLTGFIHPREVSPDPNCVPSQHLPVGTKIEGEIVNIDERTGQVKLNLNPMREAVIASLQEGAIVKGVARAYNNVGFFIRMGGIVEGLLHNRELRANGKTPEAIADGAEIEVKVLKLTPSQEKGRTNIALSRKF
jgi:ribosomal protein S1